MFKCTKLGMCGAASDHMRRALYAPAEYVALSLRLCDGKRQI